MGCNSCLLLLLIGAISAGRLVPVVFAAAFYILELYVSLLAALAKGLFGLVKIAEQRQPQPSPVAVRRLAGPAPGFGRRVRA